MNKKQCFMGLLIMILIISLVACSSPKIGEDKKIVLMTDTGGLGDESFNDDIYEGLKKAEEEFGIEIITMQPQEEKEYTSMIMNAAEEQSDMIMTVGILPTKAIEEVSEKLNEESFAVFDGTADVKNAMSITFRINEGAFLAGVIAGLTTKSNSVGFVGGLEIPTTQEYEYGFKAGVKASNPQSEVLVNYIGAYNEPNLGKQTAIAQNRLGADVVFHASGGSGLGVIEAAEEKGFWAIDVQNQDFESESEYVLGSVVKRFDMASYYVASRLVEKKYLPKDLVFTVANDGVVFKDIAGNVPENIMVKVDEYKEKISSEEIVVPYDQETYQVFEESITKADEEIQE